MSELTEAIAVYRASKYAEALPLFEELYKQGIGPKAEVETFIAHCLSMLDRDIEALHFYKEALEPDPDQIGYENYVKCLLDLQRYAEAISASAQGLEKFPDSPHLLHAQAFSLACLDKYEDALQVYEKVMKLKPKNAGVVTQVANCHRLQGNFQQAKAYFEKALEILPDDLAYYNLTRFLFESSEFEESRKVFDKALDLFPSSELLNRFLVMVEEWIGDWEEKGGTE